mmetsp:Transcript_35438/g.118483  ORF Transcript_35438/g.118483 Transcript_35438/m.118483 type:complete len:156 (-) Transcript_35438:188-655(-)
MEGGLSVVALSWEGLDEEMSLYRSASRLRLSELGAAAAFGDDARAVHLLARRAGGGGAGGGGAGGGGGAAGAALLFLDCPAIGEAELRQLAVEGASPAERGRLATALLLRAAAEASERGMLAVSWQPAPGGDGAAWLEQAGFGRGGAGAERRLLR